MTKIIGICGKGGTGKTTVAALIIGWLIKNRKGKSILAVDADPNANLEQALGVKSESSVVAIVDDISKKPHQVPQGMTRERYLEYQIQDSLVEAEGFDLLTMGRPEGPGCYCYVNNLLRTLIDKLSNSYDYIVIDNEAGMEHISRRTTRRMDFLFVISDYTAVGLRSAKKILDLVRELNIAVKEERLIINRARGKIEQLKGEVDKVGIPLAGVIPEEEQVIRLSSEDGDLSKLSDESKVTKAIKKICEEVKYACGVS